MGQKGRREVHNERYMASTSRDTGHAYDFLELCKKPVRKKTKQQTQYASKKGENGERFLKELTCRIFKNYSNDHLQNRNVLTERKNKWEKGEWDS